MYSQTFKGDIGEQTSNVEVRDLSVHYGNVRVLDRMSLSVKKGEFLVLLGPSGCGKSTLLNAIAGLQDASSGQILISGEDVTEKLPKDRGIGMVFQSYALYPRMNVAANLGFSLKIAGAPKAEVAARVESVAKTLQLEALLQRYPSELSGGQRQRVAIGRALIRNAGVFLFDEPLSNLDAKLRALLRVEIKKLHTKLKNTMIYVTHDQVEALTLADRIVVMQGGKIQQIGTPQEIYRRPQNRFVAGFLGSPSMSFIEGHIARVDGETRFTAGGSSLSCAGYAFAGARPEDERAVTIGVRPEDVVLQKPGSNGTGEGLSGIISLVEPMGADQIVWTAFANQELAIRVGGTEPYQADEPIEFRFDLSKTSMFDARSGVRL
jgi:multiple sugar transport system ATP-binding protein